MKDLVSRNIMELHGRIADACQQYDRDADDITVVAITKRFSAAAIRTAVAVGIHNVGESRVQEAEPKIAEAGPIARYHMVGHLQSNKAGKAVRLFDVIQSVDSLKLAVEIDRQAGLIDRKIECLIEVNCSGEEQKYGIAPDLCADLIRQIGDFPNIVLAGLMTVGPHVDDEDVIRSAYRHCHDLFQRGRETAGPQFNTLSMGMSGDFASAIAEGSTMIRVGTMIFGPRPV